MLGTLLNDIVRWDKKLKRRCAFLHQKYGISSFNIISYTANGALCKWYIQAAEVFRRQARVRESPIPENVAKLHAAETRMQELKANMAVLGKEAAAALSAVESQQQRLTFQRLVAMVCYYSVLQSNQISWLNGKGPYAICELFFVGRRWKDISWKGCNNSRKYRNWGLYCPLIPTKSNF